MSSPSAAPAVGTTRRLRRALTLRDLFLYGVVVIQPIAPMGPFGAIQADSRGHAVTVILVAMVAMLLTAVSYGRMAAAYPSAGSAFTYVGKEIHPAAGYVTGWGMVMDYMLNPMICVVWCSKAVWERWQGTPFALWAALFAILFTSLNLRGIKASARFNTILAAGMGVVIFIFLVAAVRYIAGHAEGVDFFSRPFYDPARWNSGAILTGTSLAVLTYIGFDGISTLAEEVENPRRNVLIATVLSCLAIGILASIEVYAAQLIWPFSEGYPSVETAFVHTAGRAGGAALSATILVTLTVATVGSGTGAQFGAARLLYGMGRSGALPAGFFAYLHPQRRVPSRSVIFVGVAAFVGALALERSGGYELGAHLLNFGALIGFMGVNLATFVHYFVRQRQHTIGNLVPPLAGFAICLLLWLNLKPEAKYVGLAWLAVGVIFGAWKTRGFRGALVNFDLPPEEEEAGQGRPA
jgi:amino acid transporter